MFDITIIIPCFNPDLRVLKRCFTSIENLNKTNIKAECLLIDNHSKPALTEHDEVKKFLSDNASWVRILMEKRQGSGYARISGFREAASPVIVTFDDDNEPEPDYLIQSLKLLKENPDVSVMGPGKVKVDYIDPSPSYMGKYKYIFQEISMTDSRFGCSVTSNEGYFPYGTGMVIRKEAIRLYLEKFVQDDLTALGRVGGILTSCEDMQLIWLAMKNGHKVGRSPSLVLTHIINGRKSNFNYVKRLTYGGGKSYLPARYEIFPSEMENIRDTGSELRKSLLRIVKVTAYNFYKPRFLILAIASQIGILESIYQLNGKKIPGLLALVRKMLKLT